MMLLLLTLGLVQAKVGLVYLVTSMLMLLLFILGLVQANVGQVYPTEQQAVILYSPACCSYCGPSSG
jgi:hypothetical protein